MHHWLNKNKGAGALLVYGLAGLALYAGLLDKSFAADDFLVVYRVSHDGLLFPSGFFRPLSDLTIWFNSLYGGFHPWAYYSFNLLLHIATAYAFFHFLRLSAPVWQMNTAWFPFLGGLLFLVYPFHNEPILWVVGRGASLAALSGCIALCAVLADWRQQTKVTVFALAYFLGMAAYETLMPLPVIAALLVYYKNPEERSWNKWLGIGILVFLIHLIFRYFVSGGFLGNYAAHIRTQSLSIWGGHWLRLMARLFVPPAPDTRQFLLQTAGLFLILLGLIIIYLRKQANRENRSLLLLLFILIQLSLIVPVSFPVSTRTSETDRLLYFPALWVVVFVLVLFKGIFIQARSFVPALAVVLIVSVYFLFQNNLHWQTASSQAKALLEQVKKRSATQQVLLLNLPDEYEGAFIFRNGFTEALLMNNIDTAKVRIANQLKPQDYPGQIRLQVRDSSHATVPPVVGLTLAGSQLQLVVAGADSSSFNITETAVAYWDKDMLHWISFPFKPTHD